MPVVRQRLGQVHEQRQRGAVRPVQVVHDHDNGSTLGDDAEQRGDLTEHPEPRARVESLQGVRGVTVSISASSAVHRVRCCAGNAATRSSTTWTHGHIDGAPSPS